MSKSNGQMVDDATAVILAVFKALDMDVDHEQITLERVLEARGFEPNVECA